MAIDRSNPAAAFESLWQAQRVQLRAFCRRRGDGNPAEAQEIFSQTALRAWRAFGGYDDREKFGAWVRQIAENEARRLERQRNRALRRFSEEDVDELAAASADDVFPAGSGFRIRQMVRMAAQAGAISADEERVVMARLQADEADWTHLAGALHLGPDACAVYWSRALPKLRVFMMIALPGLMGGKAAIRAAFDTACRDRSQPLSPLEVEAFRHEVLEGGSPRRRSGWREALRAATMKIGRHLPTVHFG